MVDLKDSYALADVLVSRTNTCNSAPFNEMTATTGKIADQLPDLVNDYPNQAQAIS